MCCSLCHRVALIPQTLSFNKCVLQAVYAPVPGQSDEDIATWHTHLEWWSDTLQATVIQAVLQARAGLGCTPAFLFTCLSCPVDTSSQIPHAAAAGSPQPSCSA